MRNILDRFSLQHKPPVEMKVEFHFYIFTFSVIWLNSAYRPPR